MAAALDAASPVFDVTEHTIGASHIRDYPRATAQSQDDALLLHVRHYVPRDGARPRRGDVTVVAAHANGFPKELYEPLWEDLCRQARRQGFRIRAVWAADAAWQGRSGLLNHGRLGNDPSWNDYARDLVHMVNTFRMPRPLVGIGHSFGANALAAAALLHPRLFASLVLLDPIIGYLDSTPAALRAGPAARSVGRRDAWPSRAAAAAAFRRSRFCRAWDARVLDRWIEHGVRPAPAGVTLTTSPHQEVFTYLRPSWPAFDANGSRLVRPERAPDLDAGLGPRVATWPFYRPEPPTTMLRLPALRPGVLYINGARSDALDPRLNRDRATRTGCGPGGSGGPAAGRVAEVTHPDHGHLIPLEAPLFCATEAAAWLRRELDRWQAEEREFDEWASAPLPDKTTVSAEFKRRMGLLDGGPAGPRAKL